MTDSYENGDHDQYSDRSSDSAELQHYSGHRGDSHQPVCTRYQDCYNEYSSSGNEREESDDDNRYDCSGGYCRIRQRDSSENEREDSDDDNRYDCSGGYCRTRQRDSSGNEREDSDDDHDESSSDHSEQDENSDDNSYHHHEDKSGERYQEGTSDDDHDSGKKDKCVQKEPWSYQDGNDMCRNIKYRLKKMRLKTYYLTNRDFRRGTYRIRKSGRYVLKENIIFDPCSENDYRPYPEDEEYQDAAYSLDFFAAITIETKDVILDLNGKSIRQSDAHALQQRFFAVIELSSAPFIPGQGPGDFGHKIRSANNCWIHNGQIGLSSHHGIHGNGPKKVVIEKLKIFNFEVAGIAINGGVKICLNKLNIGMNRQDVPVLGTYSALRFLITFYKALIGTLSKIDGAEADKVLLEHTLDGLVGTSQQALTEVLETGKYTNPVFANPSGMPDGNNYGILFHPPGVAVNDYVEENYNGKFSKHIYVNRVKIHGITSKINEIIGISKKSDGGSCMSDPSGSVIQIENITGSDGKCNGNVLCDAQLFFSKISQKYGVTLGKDSVSSDLIEWSESGTDIGSLIDQGYKYKCNGDSMFHVNKGVNVTRFDGVEYLAIKDVDIENCYNRGFLGDTVHGGHYEHSHDDQIRRGYHGTDIHGMSFSCCKYVDACNIAIYKIHTDNGSVAAIRFTNQSRYVKLMHVRVNEITSGYRYRDGLWYCLNHKGEEVTMITGYPNRCQNAFGICIEDNNCRKVDISKYKPGKIEAPCVAASLIHKEDPTNSKQDHGPKTYGDSDDHSDDNHSDDNHSDDDHSDDNHSDDNHSDDDNPAPFF